VNVVVGQRVSVCAGDAIASGLTGEYVVSVASNGDVAQSDWQSVLLALVGYWQVVCFELPAASVGAVDAPGL
jgi:hypothetical protein